jgi:hypothetical protein
VLRELAVLGSPDVDGAHLDRVPSRRHSVESASVSASVGESPDDAISGHHQIVHCRSAYLEFARANPALYEAMFTLTVDLPFAKSDAPAPVHAGFVELREALAPLAGGRDLETFTEVVWSALHGLATLSQAGRLRPDFYDERLLMMVDQL